MGPALEYGVFGNIVAFTFLYYGSATENKRPGKSPAFSSRDPWLTTTGIRNITPAWVYHIAAARIDHGETIVFLLGILGI